MTTSENPLNPYMGREEVWKIPLHCSLDDILAGGVEGEVITQIYGPPGGGKTNLCIMSCVSAARRGEKVVYIDTESSHSFERLLQVAGEDYEGVKKKLHFYEARTFEEQEFIVDNLHHVIEESFGLIVLDSAVALYRVLRDEENFQELNRRLSRQLARLLEMAREHSLAIIVTNQVYSSLGKNSNEPVAGDVLKYWSKAIVELQKNGKERLAILRRHRSLPEDLKVRFKIGDGGIVDV